MQLLDLFEKIKTKKNKKSFNERDGKQRMYLLNLKLKIIII